MIERHIRFSVTPETTTELRTFLSEEYVPSASKTEGFASARLLDPSDRDDELLMVLVFEDAEASARWRDSDTHQELAPQLGELHSGMEVLGYESA